MTTFTLDPPVAVSLTMSGDEAQALLKELRSGLDEMGPFVQALVRELERVLESKAP